MALSPDRSVTLAVIIGAHGIGGEVRLKIFAESLDNVKAHQSFNDGKLTLKSLRPNKAGAIARFAEAPDRNAAEALRGTELTVPRGALPPLPDGEYYHIDLIGLPVFAQDGTALGAVVAANNFGAGDVIEIEMPLQEGEKKPKKFMVPMNAQAVPEWTRERLVIDAAFVE